MRISARRSIIALSLSIIGVAGLSLLHHERMAFVARCSWNGNELSVCWCTHRALPDLPSAYRKVAISWSHQSNVEYAQTILAAAAWRALNHATGVDKDTVRRIRDGGLSDWLIAAAEKSGWRAARRAARKIGSSLGVAMKAGLIVFQREKT